MRRNLRDKIPLKFVLSLHHRHCVSPSHNAFSACVARWASYEVLHNRTVQQRRLEAFESYHHHILPIRLYVCQWSNWQKPDGKISAQAHTIVKQICFPNGNVLFWSLFSLSKRWIHNELWGCAEILPAKWEDYMKAWNNIKNDCDQETGKECSTIVQIIGKDDRGKVISWRSVSCKMTCYTNQMKQNSINSQSARILYQVCSLQFVFCTRSAVGIFYIVRRLQFSLKFFGHFLLDSGIQN